jgi:hypothetical protein
MGIALVVGLAAAALLFWLGDTGGNSGTIETTSASGADAFRPTSGVEASEDTPPTTSELDEDRAQNGSTKPDTRRPAERGRAAQRVPPSSVSQQRNKPSPSPDRNTTPGNKPGNEPGNEPSPKPSPNPATDDSADDKPSIDRQAIQDSLREYAPIAKQCYEDLLGEFPQAEGSVVVAFDVTAEDGQGRVELAEVSDRTDLFDVQLHDCMLKQLGEVTFPAPRDDETLRVTYPFNFESGGE